MTIDAAPATKADRPPVIRPTGRRRSDFGDGVNLCEHCTAKCCRYFALAIEEPVDRTDFDYIRWYLLHDRATVFVEDTTWYLLVYTTCRHLRHDGRCGIYETRPEICRRYTTDECEFEDDWAYERYFETPEQIQDYADAMFGPLRRDDDPPVPDRHRLRSPRPMPSDAAALPVL